MANPQYPEPRPHDPVPPHRDIQGSTMSVLMRPPMQTHDPYSGQPLPVAVVGEPVPVNQWDVEQRLRDGWTRVAQGVL